MRDFRDAKSIARDLRSALAAKGHLVSNSESLELTAKGLGLADWNTLSAAIRATGTKLKPSASKMGEEGPNPSEIYSPDLMASFDRAERLANKRRHQYTTLEHMLLSLLDDPDVVAVLKACQADVAALGADLLHYLDDELGVLVTGKEYGGPTLGLQRVVQRALSYKRSTGGAPANGAEVLACIYFELDSHAAHALVEHDIDRLDVVNVITQGTPHPPMARTA